MVVRLGAARAEVAVAIRPAETPGRPVVVGLGFVGLPTALSFVAAGRDVVGIDVSTRRRAAVRNLRVDLPPAARADLGIALESGRLAVSDDPDRVRDGDLVVICVPTPLDDHRLPDLHPLRRACESVASCAVPGQTIVLTSTTYVGCTEELLAEPLRRRGLIVGRDVFVAFSPERIDPGVAGHDPRHTPRVVGGITPECTRRAADALAPTASALHTVASAEVAELSKLLENTFRAVNIALANEFADVAREFGLSPDDVVRAASTKPYGFMAFRPGPGVGGHCIPCDPHYLLWQLRRRRSGMSVTAAAMEALAGRPRTVCRRAQEVLAQSGRPLAGARVLVVGVTYKPDVADVRESPALEIITGLRSAGARVAFTDPLVDTVEIDGARLTGVHRPDTLPWDLVVVHTVSATTDLGWLPRCRAILDTTYRLGDLPQAQVL